MRRAISIHLYERDLQQVTMQTQTRDDGGYAAYVVIGDSLDDVTIYAPATVHRAIAEKHLAAAHWLEEQEAERAAKTSPAKPVEPPFAVGEHVRPLKSVGVISARDVYEVQTVLQQVGGSKFLLQLLGIPGYHDAEDYRTDDVPF